MKPVDQTTFGFPGGNCFSACVASILELPIEAVPYFMGHTDVEAEGWEERFSEWLIEYGLYSVTFLLHGDWRPPGFYILSGTSPRAKTDEMHSIVARRHEMVHDPHPSRDGVLTNYDVCMLVPMDPAAAGLLNADVRSAQDAGEVICLQSALDEACKTLADAAEAFAAMDESEDAAVFYQSIARVRSIASQGRRHQTQPELIDWLVTEIDKIDDRIETSQLLYIPGSFRVNGTIATVKNEMRLCRNALIEIRNHNVRVLGEEKKS